MALIKCPECKHSVSTSAGSCPKCGYLLTDEDKSKRPTGYFKGCLMVIGGFFLIGLIGSLFDKGSTSNTTNTTTNSTVNSSTKEKPAEVPTTSNPATQTINAKLKKARSKYDNSRGNNADAANTANRLLKVLKRTGNTDDIDVFLELTSSDDAEQAFLNGGDLDTYRSKVTTIFFTVRMDNSLWDYSLETAQRDLVASFVIGIRNIYPNSLPHVTVNNGIRNVATGSWSLFRSEADVELK